MPDVPLDPLKFRDVKRYTDRLKENRAKTGRPDAVRLTSGRLEDMPVVVAVQDRVAGRACCSDGVGHRSLARYGRPARAAAEG